MAEYIDREAALKRFEEIKQSGISLKDAIYIDGVMAVIETLLAADVEPVRRGEWIEDDYAFNRCSECGYEFDSPEIKTPYCPNCGAKMGGE